MLDVGYYISSPCCIDCRCKILSLICYMTWHIRTSDVTSLFHDSESWNKHHRSCVHFSVVRWSDINMCIFLVRSQMHDVWLEVVADAESYLLYLDLRCHICNPWSAIIDLTSQILHHASKDEHLYVRSPYDGEMHIRCEMYDVVDARCWVLSAIWLAIFGL